MRIDRIALGAPSDRAGRNCQVVERRYRITILVSRVRRRNTSWGNFAVPLTPVARNSDASVAIAKMYIAHAYCVSYKALHE